MIRQARSLWFSFKERLFLRRHATRAQRFSAIYEERIWQNPETASGFGSTLSATGELRRGLVALIEQEGVLSILDAPCGDYNWQPALGFVGHYTGVDIVPDLIAENRRQYGNDRTGFEVVDLVEEVLPRAELVLCRECLNHLPLEDAAKALEHLEQAAQRFLLVTHYPGCTANQEQPASFRYRPLNMTLPPFSLRPPDAVIEESAFEAGKQVAIWRMEGRALRASQQETPNGTHG